MCKLVAGTGTFATGSRVGKRAEMGSGERPVTDTTGNPCRTHPQSRCSVTEPRI